MGQEADVPRPDVEQLDRVRDRRRVVSPQRIQLEALRIGVGIIEFLGTCTEFFTAIGASITAGRDAEKRG